MYPIFTLSALTATFLLNKHSNKLPKILSQTYSSYIYGCAIGCDIYSISYTLGYIETLPLLLDITACLSLGAIALRKIEATSIAKTIVGAATAIAFLPIEYVEKSKMLYSIKHAATSTALAISFIAFTGKSGKIGAVIGVITLMGTPHNILPNTNDKESLLENSKNNSSNSDDIKPSGDLFNDLHQDQTLYP